MSKGNKEFFDLVRSREFSPPQKLYKYVTIDAARQILKNDTIRFQSPLNYNDPFDAQWNVFWPLYTREARDFEVSLLQNAILNPDTWPAHTDEQCRKALIEEHHRIASLPPNQRKTAAGQFAIECADHGVPDQLRAKMHDTRRRLRVFCLCEGIFSILMWSHYADNHRGLILGFDATRLEHGFSRPLEPVNYSHELPRLIDYQGWIRSTTFGLPIPPVLGAEREWALSKHIDWKYEREWRFVWVANKGTSGDYEDFQIPEGSFTEIIFGCRARPADSSEIIELTNVIRHDIQLQRMSIHPSKFELVKCDIDN
jgi:hypothetical protein